MEAKQLTSGLFEVDLGSISVDRRMNALRELSATIGDKELLGLLQIDTQQLLQPTTAIQGQVENLLGQGLLPQAVDAGSQAVTGTPVAGSLRSEVK